MVKKTIFFFLFAFVMVYGEEKDDHGQYGNHNLWRKTFCEKKDDVLNEEIQHCMTLEKTHFYDTFKTCLDEVLPSVKGSFILYQKMACKDKSIYHKIDECIAEQNAAYTTMNKSAADCFIDVLKKHKLPELIKKYFSFMESAHK